MTHATHATDARRSAPESAPADSRGARRRVLAGRVLFVLVLLFLLMDAVGKLAGLAPSVEGTMELGFERDLVPWIGAILLGITVLYALPRTAALGAVLLTGFLGGAVAIQLQVGNPLLSHVLFPIYVGCAAWGSLVLRDVNMADLFRRGSSPR